MKSKVFELNSHLPAQAEATLNKFLESDIEVVKDIVVGNKLIFLYQDKVVYGVPEDTTSCTA